MVRTMQEEFFSKNLILFLNDSPKPAFIEGPKTKHMMKKFFAIFLAITVVPTFNTYAWVGGPFDNNSHTPEGDDGIYEAVATVPNGTGLYRWGVGNRATATNFNDGRPGNTSNVQFGAFIGTNNANVWYFQGETFYGSCFGTVNSAISEIRCIGTAGTAIPTNFGFGMGNNDISIGNPVSVPTIQIIQTTTTTQTTDVDGNLTQTQTETQTPTILIVPPFGSFANSEFRAEMTRDQSGQLRHQPWSREFFGTGTLQVSGMNVYLNQTTAQVQIPANVAATVQVPIPMTVFGSRVSLVRNG